jgi:hypothetical protein
MSNLGVKFNRSRKQLGQKIDKGGHRMGNKINHALSKSNATMRKIDNTLGDMNRNGAGLLPVVGRGIQFAKLGAHLGHAITNRAHNNELEKYNRRKSTEEAMTNMAGGAFV